jgi:alpha-D-ribose 1-methylphosphonate 5-triphosphate synthase subunit PhnH
MNAPFSPGRGFSDPVHGPQAFFRSVLSAMSRPGHIVAVPDMGVDGPSDLPKEALGILLALCDQDTAVWLDPALCASELPRWLAFHANCKVTKRSESAAFGVLREGGENPDLSQFALGDERYPDRSTTLIVLARAMTGGPSIRLEGPGIEKHCKLAPLGLPKDFISQAQDNHKNYPRGLDFLLLAEHAMCGLPRSTRITTEPC